MRQERTFTSRRKADISSSLSSACLRYPPVRLASSGGFRTQGAGLSREEQRTNGVRPKFLADAGPVHLHGPSADAKVVCDHLAAFPAGDRLQNLHLPGAETRQLRSAGVGGATSGELLELPDRAVDGLRKGRASKGLADVVRGSAVEGFDGCGSRGLPGEEDDGHITAALDDFPVHRMPVHARHANVEQDDAAGERVQLIQKVPRIHERSLRRLAGEHYSKNGVNRGVVIYDIDMHLVDIPRRCDLLVNETLLGHPGKLPYGSPSGGPRVWAAYEVCLGLAGFSSDILPR